MQEIINIFVKSIFIDNMKFAFFLGMCSYLAVSKTVKTSMGLGIAVVFVLLITVPLNYIIDNYLLKEGALAWISPKFATIDLSYLSFIIFSRCILKILTYTIFQICSFSDINNLIIFIFMKINTWTIRQCF